LNAIEVGAAILMISSSDILHGKVLIVDDQEANVLLLERMLRGAGYVSITSTMDPGEVCELHLKNRYDLILLDLQMPGMDGFQVMESLKEIRGILGCMARQLRLDHPVAVSHITNRGCLTEAPVPGAVTE
jgi:Response regulators consisting of a CheY-like receiver domain and a winged-helix DNA-binding domain